MKRDGYLDEAKRIICTERVDVHGNPEDCFSGIAALWTAYLSNKYYNFETPLLPEDVAMMMSLFKIGRYQMNPLHEDNVVDAIGYIALAAELSKDE